MFGVFFQFSTPIPQDPLPQSFFSEQQPEVVVDFGTSLLAHFTILFLHQRDGRDDDDDVFCHTGQSQTACALKHVKGPAW